MQTSNMLENTQESNSKLKNAIQEQSKIVHVQRSIKTGLGWGGQGREGEPCCRLPEADEKAKPKRAYLLIIHRKGVGKTAG